MFLGLAVLMLTAASVPAVTPGPAVEASVCRHDNLWAEEVELAGVLLLLQDAPADEPGLPLSQALSQLPQPDADAPHCPAADSTALDCREGRLLKNPRAGARCDVRIGARVRHFLRQRDARTLPRGVIPLLTSETAGWRAAPPCPCSDPLTPAVGTHTDLTRAGPPADRLILAHTAPPPHPGYQARVERPPR